MAKRTAKKEDWRQQTLPTNVPQEAISDEEWNQPAADKRGHSARVECRVPPAVKRVIESLIASQKFPYETADDLLRHALIRHLYLLHSLDGTVPKTLFTVAFSVMRMAQDHQNVRQMQEAVREAAAVLDDLAAEGDFAEISRKIAFVDSALSMLPDTSPWKRRFQKLWRARSQRYREAVSEHETTYSFCPSGLPNELPIL